MSEDTPKHGESLKSDAGLKEQLSSEMGWGSWVIDIAIRARFRCEYCDRDLLSSVDAYKEWQHDRIIPQSVDTWIQSRSAISNDLHESAAFLHIHVPTNAAYSDLSSAGAGFGSGIPSK